MVVTTEAVVRQQLEDEVTRKEKSYVLPLTSCIWFPTLKHMTINITIPHATCRNYCLLFNVVCKALHHVMMYMCMYTVSAMYMHMYATLLSMM